MAKFSIISAIIALLACFAAVNVVDSSPLQALSGINTCHCVRTNEYMPLCGSDGNTYGNPSDLQCQNKCYRSAITKLYDGRCQNENVVGYPPFQGINCRCVRTNENNPVCGSDGKTYGNPSLLQCQNVCFKSGIVQLHYGECGTTPNTTNKPNRYCGNCKPTGEHKPVCASNGKTYRNFSEMSCEAICEKTFLQVIHQGECP